MARAKAFLGDAPEFITGNDLIRAIPDDYDGEITTHVSVRAFDCTLPCERVEDLATV